MTFVNELFDFNQARMLGALSMRESFEYRSTVVRTAGRQEQVASRSEEYQFSTDLGETLIGDCDFNYLNVFFVRMRGRLNGFRYKPLIDNFASESRYYPIPADTDVWQQGVCVSADPSQQVGQLAKLYHVAGHNTYKYITKPAGDVLIFVAGSPVVPFNIDYTTGLVVFEAPVAFDQVTARFYYDLPAYFDRDDLPNANLVDTGYTQDASPLGGNLLGEEVSIHQIQSVVIREDLRGEAPAGVTIPQNPLLYVDLRFNDLSDSAGTISTLTASGNASISANQFREAPAALFLPGVGDKVTTSADLVLPNSNSSEDDVTFGFWVYPLSFARGSAYLKFLNSFSSDWSISYCPFGTSPGLALWYGVIGGERYFFGINPIVGQWGHIAVSVQQQPFSFPTVRLFFNGNLVFTRLNPPFTLGTAIVFGESGDIDVPRNPNAYIDKFVILKGVGAAQTSSFSPNLPPWI